jgi:hypothetical protein
MNTTALQQTARLASTAAKPATASRREIAREAYSISLRALIFTDDRNPGSVDWQVKQLTEARQVAQRSGHLTAEDICEIEREAVA